MDSELCQNIVALHKERVMPTYSADLLLVKGRGPYVWDCEGARYVDFTCGISVCNLGHCHPAVSAAIKKQCSQLVHVSNLFINDKQPLLADRLAKLSFDAKAFFSNSGAEANEGMIKFARKWGSGKGRFEVVCMEDSFHGRTLATLAATGRSKYRAGFAPDTQGFKHVPFNNLDALAAAIDDKTAAVLLEPVQGEGGVLKADPAYLKGARELCDARGVLLMFDEVQCGMGRTGKMFAYQNYPGIEPDVMSLAKALANGYPIGAFLARRSLGDVLTPGTHASTFGGTPLACAAALATLDVFEKENLLDNCLVQGAVAMEMLSKLARKRPVIQQVRGLGLMIGIVLDRDSKPLIPIARKEGLLIVAAGENVVRFYPPINVKRAEIAKAVRLLDRALVKFVEPGGGQSI